MNDQPAAIVRDVVRADFGQWRPLWDGYQAFYGRVGPTAVPEAIMATTWSRFFDAYEPVHGLVAEHEGQLIGLVHFIFHRNTGMIGPTCYLQDLFTSEAARGRGVGQALINAVYDRARAAGSSRVYWHTHTTNTIAMQLYDKLADKSGFVVYRKDV